MNTRTKLLQQQQQTTQEKQSTGIINTNLIKEVIQISNLQREQELIIKERYLNHLKSIDISKYSYPNETKPPTDYTYAHTSSYLSDSYHQNETWEMPNLRRRSRLSHQDSHFLSKVLDVLAKVIAAFFNLFKFKNYFKRETSIPLNDSGYESSSLSSLTSSRINQLETKETIQIQASNNKKKYLFFIFVTCLLLAILFGLYSSNVNKDYIVPTCKYVNELRYSFVDNVSKYLLIILNESLHLVMKLTEVVHYLFDFLKCTLSESFNYLLLITTTLKTKLQSKTSYNDDIEYKIKTNSYLTSEQTDKLLNEMKLFKEKIYSDIKLNLDTYKQNNNLVDLDAMQIELDRKFNMTIALISKQFVDQARLIETSKSAYESELKQMKLVLNEIESKYAFALDQLEEQLRKQKVELDKQNENYQQQLNSINQQATFKVNSFTNEYISFEKIEEFINKTFYVYNADKTGMTDFASESVGGSILFTRCTESYQDNSRWFTIFDVPITRVSVSPRVVIQGQIQPGNCWAFKGSKGDLFIKLAAKITPKSFSLEHIPKELSLTGSIDSAPQNFTVYGFVNKDDISDDNRILLGNYRYDSNSRYPLQFFKVEYECNDRPIAAVELKIESNAGNKEYTCLYKFRVHGKLFSQKSENEKQN